MQAFTFLAALAVAAFAQWINTHPNVPTPVVKFGLAAIGLAMYLVVQTPEQWSGPVFFEWMDKAWLWACALPGMASLIGTAPAMGTNSK